MCRTSPPFSTNRSISPPAQACIARGVFERPPKRGLRYVAFSDPSGGSNDAFTLAIAHAEADSLIVDCIREVRPPFSPESVVSEFAQLLKTYRISRVMGDRYAGEWPRDQFRKCGIAYEPSAKPKSGLYRDMLPLLNSRRCELLDNARLIAQITTLERRTARGGRDSIDHPLGAHDDVANCVAGALTSITEPRRKLRMGVFGYGGPVIEVDVTGGARVGDEPARIRWVTVDEASAGAAKGP